MRKSVKNMRDCHKDKYQGSAAFIEKKKKKKVQIKEI